MKSFLVNQFNLTDIENFNEDKCTDTLAFLRYILKKSETPEEKKEISTYMDQISARCNQLRSRAA